MTLLEACVAAREGNFVSHTSFDSKQSMHQYKSDLYYEDGANLTEDGFIETLEKEDWAKEGWYIKYKKESIDRKKLKDLHESNKHMMLRDNKSYEDCIINN